MVLRWVGCSVKEASRGFRAVRGYGDMKRLTAALKQRVALASDVQRRVA